MFILPSSTQSHAHTQEQAKSEGLHPALIHVLSSMTDGLCGLSRVGESCAGQQSTGVSGCLMGELPPLKGLSDLLLVRNQCHVIVLLAALDGPPRPERGESSRLLWDHAHTCSHNVHPHYVVGNVFHVKVRKRSQLLVCHFSCIF